MQGGRRDGPFQIELDNHPQGQNIVAPQVDQEANLKQQSFNEAEEKARLIKEKEEKQRRMK